jgi:hypothetical protein
MAHSFIMTLLDEVIFWTELGSEFVGDLRLKWELLLLESVVSASLEYLSGGFSWAVKLRIFWFEF